jgi:hypothetical protein
MAIVACCHFRNRKDVQGCLKRPENPFFFKLAKVAIKIKLAIFSLKNRKNVHNFIGKLAKIRRNFGFALLG